MDLSTTTCPECGAPLEHHAGFRTWCPACEWNLAAEPEPPQGPLATVYRDLGTRLGTRLFESLRSAPPEEMRPRLTSATILAFAVAGLVHLASVALLLLGLFSIWADWFNWFLGLAGVLLIIAAWGLAPKPAPAPDHPLSRDQAPVLYSLADRVAEALGTDRVDTICVYSDINAFMGRYGWRRRSLLGIGAPLWLCLDAPQKLALVAHEMAHQVNGDVSRSFWIGDAVDALDQWLEFLRQPYDPDASLGEILGHYLIWAASVPLGFVHGLLIHLHWRQSQRAEYLADYLGSRVSGTDAYLSCAYQVEIAMSRGEDLVRAVQQCADAPVLIAPTFAEIALSVPGIERDRIRRAARRELTALDATHPPTFYRAELVRAFPCEPAVAFSEDEARQTEAEVLIHGRAVGRELVRTYLNLI